MMRQWTVEWLLVYYGVFRSDARSAYMTPGRESSWARLRVF